MALSFIDTKDPYNINFELKDIPVSLVNAIRRTAMTDYVTVGFKTEEYVNSDLQVLHNSSSVHNEYILHRLGLIPINIENITAFNPSNYKFILNKQNDTNNTIDVTSEHFTIINMETDEEEDVNDFFPPDPITGDHILILKLKSNPNKKGEKIHIEGKCSKGTGKENARFMPTSCIAFNNKRDDTKMSEALEDFLQATLTEEQLTNSKIVKNKSLEFELAKGDRYFYTNANNEPNIFDMTIESKGHIKSSIIFINTLKLLKTKCEQLKEIINNILVNNILNEKISIGVSPETMDAIEIKMIDETHTIGSLIQTFATQIFDSNKLNFIGYKNPHPLKKFIVIKLKTESNSSSEINEVITETFNKIIDIIEGMLTESENYFKLPKKKKLTLKIKKKTT
jgi:DNA-directed RNA polymerase subunit L/DNA-directed RNA polymerase alpha subunit